MIKNIEERYSHRDVNIALYTDNGGASVMAVVWGNGHSDTNSNPGWGWLHFT